MELVRFIIHFRIIPEGSFVILNVLLSTIVIDISESTSPSLILTPFRPYTPIFYSLILFYLLLDLIVYFFYSFLFWQSFSNTSLGS